MSTSIPPPIQFVKESAEQSIPGSTLQIGQILLRMGKITLEDIEKIARLQKKNNVLFGAAAKQLGLISDGDVQNALTYQADPSYSLLPPTYASPNLPISNHPNSPLTESIRSIRTQLMLRGFPSNHNSLAIIGINRNSGTSQFVASLAILFSQLGKQTLLIDGDFRKPTQQLVFNLSNPYGLTDVLTEHVTITEALDTLASCPNLSLLTTGAVSSYSSELLSTSKFCSTHELLVRQFDIVLYDTPAFLESTDALMIASHSDYALLVIHKNQSRLTDVNTVSKQMIDNGIQIIGSIFVDY